MNTNEKKTVFDILNNVGFYDMKHKKGLNSARRKDALYNLPQTIPKIRNALLPASENKELSYEEISDDHLEGQGNGKKIIPTNIIDIYTRLEILLELKLTGHTNTLTEA